jgi:hypothetical protein
MAIQPIAAVAASSTTTRNVRRRTTNNTSSDNDHVGRNGALGDLSSLFDTMQRNNRTLLQWSFRDIQTDYESSLASLDRARSDNDDAHVSFYEMACHNLLEELRATTANWKFQPSIASMERAISDIDDAPLHTWCQTVSKYWQLCSLFLITSIRS